MMRARSSLPGVTMIEIIIIIAVASIALFSLATLMLVSLDFVVKNLHVAQASILAQEGMEAMRILRNAGWGANIAPLSAGAPYYPLLSGTTWTLQDSFPGPINTIFTRSIAIEEVFRDTDNNIASSGTSDANTKKISVTVTWQEHGQTKTVTIPMYLTNLWEN